MSWTLPAFVDDVSVELAPVPSGLEQVTASGVLWQVGPQGFHLTLPGVARYLVHEGRSIRVDLENGACMTEAAALLRMTPLAALCYQRGLMVFHASVVTSNGRTLMLAGASAAGKSTLAATLLSQGWRLVADDLAPVSFDVGGRPVVLPTFPEVVLWKKASDMPVQGPTEAHVSWKMLSSHPARTVVSVEDHFMADPVLLSEIWWLLPHSENDVTVEQIRGANKFERLFRLAYNVRIAEATLDPSRYLQLAADLARAVPLHLLHRPRSWLEPACVAQRLQVEPE